MHLDALSLLTIETTGRSRYRNLRVVALAISPTECHFAPKR